jgi:hypothetical protein
VSDHDAVLSAARARAAALVAADAEALAELLHPGFRWSTHTGLVLDRAAYVLRNTGGGVAWRGQELVEPSVVVVGDTAVLHCVVEDALDVGEFRMPVTQTWVRAPGAVHGWRCLAGHAGPSLSLSP